MTKPRLLFIGPLPEPTTGQSLACKVLLDGLRHTYEIDVVDLRKEQFQQGVNSLGRVREVTDAVAAVRKRQRDADVIYLTISESVAGNLKDIAFYIACGRRLDRLVVHLHGGAGMRVLLGGKLPFLAALNRYFLRRMGGVIVLGARLANMYQSFLPPARIAEVANFAPDDLFVEDVQIDANFTDTGPLRVLFLSNLLPGKGHDDLLVALGMLTPEERAALTVDFAGGFEDAQAKANFLALTATFPNTVVYRGVVGGETKCDLLRRAHLFCLPTYYPYEGQPISILEAYAAGTAVLTTDHSGIFDVFTPEVNGFAVEKQAPVAIAAALRRALKERAILHRIARTNAIVARELYREQHYVARMKEALNRLGSMAAD